MDKGEALRMSSPLFFTVPAVRLIIFQINVDVNSTPNARAMRKKLKINGENAKPFAHSKHYPYFWQKYPD